MEIQNTPVEPQTLPEHAAPELSVQEKLALSFEERTFDELRQDTAFLRLRNILLAVVAFGGGGLFAAGWLMFNQTLTLIDFISIVAAFVAAVAFVTKRLNAKKAAVVERLKKEDEETIRRVEYEEALAEYHRQHAEAAAAVDDSASTSSSEDSRA